MIYMHTDVLTETVEEMRAASIRRPVDLLSAAMAEIVEQAVTHKDDCYLCEGYMENECTIFTNGVILASAWRVAKALERA